MLKEGLYVSENHENALEAYTIKMHVKETEKSYIFTLIDFESRYSGAHIEMLFKNSKRFVLRKNRGGHALQTWEMTISHSIRIRQEFRISLKWSKSQKVHRRQIK